MNVRLPIAVVLVALATLWLLRESALPPAAVGTTSQQGASPDAPAAQPDRALDATMRAELRVVLQELHRAGRTIVLSSHHLEELQELATRLEFLRDGRLVPAVEVERARSRLLHRFRVRLAGDRALPPGCRELQRDADGMLVLESDGPPLQWLRQLDPAEVRAAEIGHTRLEDLYQLLFLPHLDAAGASAADAAAARATR